MKRSFGLNRYLEGESYSRVRSLVPALILMIMLPLFILINGEGFLSSVTFLHILGNFVPLALTGVGMFLVIRRGQLDLSLSSIVGFSAFLTAWLIEKGELSPIAALPLVLLGGLLLGALNGLLVTALRRLLTNKILPRFLPSLLVTIVTMFAIRYSTWLLSNKEVIALNSDLVNRIVSTNMGRLGTALLALLSILFFNLFDIFYRKKAGGSSKLSLLAIRVAGSLIIGLLFLFSLITKVSPLYLLYFCGILAALTAYIYLLPAEGGRAGLTISFALSGLLAALAGIIIVNRISGASPYSGVNYELNSLLIVLLAGGSLFRSEGRVGGVIMAALMAAVGAIGFIMMGFGLFINPFVKIALVLIFIAFDFVLFRMSKSGKGA